MKHLFASHLAVLFLVPVASNGGLVGRLRGQDAGVLTHPYRHGFVRDSDPRIVAHPFQDQKTSKKIALGMHRRESSVSTVPADEEYMALKEYGWVSPDDRRADGTHPASRQIARQIAEAVWGAKSARMPEAPSPAQAPGSRPQASAAVRSKLLDSPGWGLKAKTINSGARQIADAMSPREAKIGEAKSARMLVAPSPAQAPASRPQASAALHRGVQAKAIKKSIRMCSVNQRLCANEALELYRIGHIVGALLDRYQIAWWATGGTLLGAVRNKGVIPHDDDLDYNILGDQIEGLLSPRFKEDLEKNGLHMHPVEEGFWQIKPVGKMGDVVHVDIFAMYRHLCMKQLCYPHHWWAKDKFPESMCSPDHETTQSRCPELVRWPFGDSGTIWGPPEALAKSYLNQVYGPDWHVPKCEDTNHPCGLVQNITHDATERAEPSGDLLEPVF